MKTLLKLVAFVIVAYIVAAVVAWRLLPEKISDAEKRLFDVRVALAKLSNDQLVLSNRLRAITDSTLGQGKSKIDEVIAILGDADINHLALTYMGSDWSIQRSSFMGQVAHRKSSVQAQVDARKGTKSRLNDKIRELERRRLALVHDISASEKNSGSQYKWAAELKLLDLKIEEHKSIDPDKGYLKQEVDFGKDTAVHAKNQDELFNLSSQYQEQTVGALNRIMSEKLAALRWEEDSPGRIKRFASWFNVWPLNLIMKMPIEDEKRF